MMKNITSKHNILITGASSGIGKELALLYIAKGHKVALLARRLPLLEEIKESIPSPLKENVRLYQCDVTRKEAVQKTLSHCIEKMGKIDCVIANSGVSHSSPGDELDSKLYEKTHQVNFMGAVYTFEAIIPHMIEMKTGHLVSISSLASFRGLPEAGAYCSSKAALSALTESLRLDLKKHGISVSLINPGFIKSPMTQQNLYYMPQLLSTKIGALKIYRAIERKKTIYSFPIPFAWLVKWLRFLPPCIYDFLLKNRKNKKQTLST